MTDWSADPWFARHAWVAPRVGETRRSGFKSLRPHALFGIGRNQAGLLAARSSFRPNAVHVPSCRASAPALPFSLENRSTPMIPNEDNQESRAAPREELPEAVRVSQQTVEHERSGGQATEHDATHRRPLNGNSNGPSSGDGASE